MRITIIVNIIFYPLFSFGQEVHNSKRQWTYQECITYAQEKNKNIKTAELSKNASDINYKHSKSLRLPNLTGSASQNLSFGNSIDPITSQFLNQQIQSTSIGINSTLQLYNGSQISNQIKQNKILAEQNSLFVEESKNNVILRITEAYIEILYNKEEIRIAENNLVSSEKEVERSKLKLDAGNIARKDYTDAISQAATNKYNLITAQNNLSQQLLTLKQLIELEPEEDFDVVVPSNLDAYITEIPNKMEVYNTALTLIPEIKASQLNIAITEKELAIAKGSYLPTLSLTGSLGTGYTNTQNLTFSDQLNLNFNQRLGLNLSIPIFNRNQTKAQIQSAKINVDKTKIALETTKKDLYKKIQTAWENAIATREQLVSALAAKIAAEESYLLAQKKYELGALSTADLVISQNTYTNAAQNYIQAKYLTILHTKLLSFYQGTEIKF